MDSNRTICTCVEFLCMSITLTLALQGAMHNDTVEKTVKAIQPKFVWIIFIQIILALALLATSA